MKKLWLALSSLIVCLVFSTSLVEAQTDKIQIQTRFISESGVQLEDLSKGATGQGVIFYYIAGRGVDYPTLAVRLSKTTSAPEAKAEVYQPQPGLDYVHYKMENNRVIFDSPYPPAIIIKALGGWWTRNGLTNYNLDIQINGPMYSMWGAEYDTVKGTFGGWASKVKYIDETVKIQVRDPQGEGLPKWDWRTLIPTFNASSYLRTNYAERKCSSPTRVEPGVSPAWPFVAESGGYEPPVGSLRPPIVVDWKKGLISHFAEMVTVRNQNCSYSFYGIDQMKPGELNQTNFETPFAFYDLSGQGQGYPNLIMRTEHFSAKDKWSFLLDSKTTRGRLAPLSFETIRYSWRNAVGDGSWDYKVELLGFQPYTSDTKVADGTFRVDAPNYDEYPGWAIGKSWPVVTFVSPETMTYKSSEGIYDWTPRSVGIGYLFGWQDKPDLSDYSDIATGLRGEYRYQREATPKLYFSPIDNRLHLLGAEAGLWRLDKNEVLRLQNLNSGNYINGWTLEKLPQPNDTDKKDDTAPSTGEIEQALYNLNGFLIYSGPQGLVLQRNSAQPSLFEIQPPTDKASWQKSQEQLAPYTGQKRDQTNLLSWLEAFPAETTRFANIQLTGLRATSDGFRLTLKVSADSVSQGATLPGLAKFALGEYVVSYAGAKFQIEQVTEAQPSVTLSPGTIKQLAQNTLPVTLQNGGQQDLSQVQLELWGKTAGATESIVVSQTVSLPARQSSTLNLSWTPPTNGKWVLTPKLRTSDGKVLSFSSATVEVAPLKEPSSIAVISVSSVQPTLILAVIGMLIFVVIASVVIHKQWRLANTEQQENAD